MFNNEAVGRRYPCNHIGVLSTDSALGVGVPNSEMWKCQSHYEISVAEALHKKTTIPTTTITARMATQIIQLPDVERLSSSVIRILGGNPGKVR
jgi:hypothetical protein